MTDISKLANLVKELEDQFLRCIKCGMCQSVCPLFEQTKREADVARGKLSLIDGLMHQMFSSPDGAKERLEKCLLCGSCAANCPSGVQVVEIFIKARIILAQYKGLSPVKKVIFKNMLSSPKTFNRVMEWAGKFQGLFTKQNKNTQETSCTRIMSPVFKTRHFKPIAKIPLHKQIPALDTQPGPGELKVAFFTGCLIDKIFPDIAHAAIKVLTHHNIGIYMPKDQGCCGIPALASGDIKTFEKLVEYHVDLFEKQSVDYIITACATCTSTIKKLWPAIYNSKQKTVLESIKKISDKTLDINQFIVNHTSFKELTTPVDDKKTMVTYHDPCHLKKSLGVFKEPREILVKSGLDLVEMESSDKCCGMGGSFNLFHYELSSNIGNLKQDCITKTNCKIVATGCPACMTQLSDMLSKNRSNILVKHPIELYAATLPHKKKKQ